MVDLTHGEIRRYSRHLIMPEVALEGQKKLKAAGVLLIGTGGLGSPAALYLAAAGIGHLGLVDFDVVDETNLQRQILHGSGDVGRPKLHSARDRIREINPGVEVVLYETALEEIAHLQGARLIPIGDLPARMHELDSADEIVLYCRTGERSARALHLLRDAGFRRLKNLRGGINAWARTVDPSLPEY